MKIRAMVQKDNRKCLLNRIKACMLHERLVLISGWAVTSCFIDRKCVFIWIYFMLRITTLQRLIGWARPWQHLHKFWHSCWCAGIDESWNAWRYIFMLCMAHWLNWHWKIPWRAPSFKLCIICFYSCIISTRNQRKSMSWKKSATWSKIPSKFGGNASNASEPVAPGGWHTRFQQWSMCLSSLG